MSGQVYEIVLPPQYNYFKVKTKNPLRTMQRVFANGDIEEVAVKYGFGYVYVSREELTKLLDGEVVWLTVTSGPPFTRWGICEAWTSAVFTRGDFGEKDD